MNVMEMVSVGILAVGLFVLIFGAFKSGSFEEKKKDIGAQLMVYGFGIIGCSAGVMCYSWVTESERAEVETVSIVVTNKIVVKESYKASVNYYCQINGIESDQKYRKQLSTMEEVEKYCDNVEINKGYEVKFKYYHEANYIQ